MKNLLIMLLLCATGACSSRVLLNDTNNLMEGNYYGDKFLYSVFIKITKDSAIVDWFYIDKCPLKTFTDTIIINRKDSNKWQGKVAAIIKEKNRLYFEAKSHFSPDEIIRIRIQLNEEEYKKCEIYKNEAFLRKENSEFNRSNSNINKSKINERHKVRTRLKNEYKIVEKSNTLKHEDFLIEYEKFKQELLKELLLMDE